MVNPNAMVFNVFTLYKFSTKSVCTMGIRKASETGCQRKKRMIPIKKKFKRIKASLAVAVNDLLQRGKLDISYYKYYGECVL